MTPIGANVVNVCVDYYGNGGLLTDSNGNGYDELFVLNELQSQRLYAPALPPNQVGYQTGTIVYVCDNSGAKLAAAWGQDPTTASGGNPALDAGTGIPPQPSFSAGKSAEVIDDVDGNGQASPGDTLLYTIFIRNDGRVPVVDVVALEDSVPANTGYVVQSTEYFYSLTGTTTAIPDNPAAPVFPLLSPGFELGTLPVGQRYEVYFEVVIDDPLPADVVTIVNRAVVSSGGQEIPAEVKTPINSAGIAIEKTVYLGSDAGASCPGTDLIVTEDGEAIVYCFTVTNTGDTYLDPVDIVDPLLGITATSDLTFVSGDPLPLQSGGVQVYAYQTVSPNATVVNTATATGTPADAQGDPLRDENGNLLQPAVDSDTAEVQYTDVLPDIRIRKRAVPETVTEPGETVSFRIVAINRSSEEVTLDSLIDSIYGDLNGLGTCSVPQTLAPAGQPNDRYRCRFEEDVMGVAGDTETDVVTGEASDNDGNTASDDASATVTVLPLLPKITVKKTAVPTTLPEPGGDVQFRIVVINKVAKAVEITSLMDDVYGDLNGQGNCSVPQQLAPAGQAGDRYRCRFTVPVSGQPGDYRDVVVAGAEDADGNTTSADDDAIVTLTDVLPKISVDKTADPRAIDLPGGDVEFTVRVTNDAAEAVTIAVLEDDVFGPLNGQGSCVVPISLAPKGAPGDSYQCSFTGAVSGPPGIFTNTVTASGSDNDGNDTSASDVATVVLADPGIVDGIKTKLTMYYAPPDLTGVDRLTFNGYLRPVGGEVFDLPFNQDVTVIAEIPDPQNPAQVYSAFVGTVPAGSVSSAASKYRYLARGSGINELVFETVSQDKIYAYLFVDAIDLLQQVRTSMSEADYLAFIEQIDRYTLRFLIAGRSWTTEIPLLPAAVTEHKLQLEKQP